MGTQNISRETRSATSSSMQRRTMARAVGTRSSTPSTGEGIAFLPMAELSIGTSTFLFTDVEGSTRLWEDLPDAMRQALAQHDDLLHACIESAGGRVFKTVGDA